MDETTTIYDCPVRNKKNFPGAVWKVNPKKYPYVRESNFMTHDPNIIPNNVYRRRWGKVIYHFKVIGYVVLKIKDGSYIGPYWYLNDSDLGMENKDTGYGKDELKKYGIIPHEGVTFCPVEDHRSRNEDMSEAEREHWRLESNLGPLEIFKNRSGREV